MRPVVSVFSSRLALMEGACERIIESAARAVAARGRFTWVLAGGSTPRQLYAMLAEPRFAGRVAWPRVHCFWGDERCVPPDHPDSNYRMAKETLLDAVALPAAHVHRMRGEDEPQAAAAAYARHLADFFGDPGLEPPCFDLVLLGMGLDGHTASLFPGSAALHEKKLWVAPNLAPDGAAWRITLTTPVLNAAARVLFLVDGSAKAARLKQAVEGGAAGAELPVHLIQPGLGPPEYLVDADAAAALDPF